MENARDRRTTPVSPRARGPAFRRRIGGGMLIAGGVLALVSIVLPHSPAHAETPTLVAGALAIALGGTLVARPTLLPLWTTPLLVAFGTLLITLATRTAGVEGVRAADNEILYLMVVIYSFSFLSTPHAFAQLALIGGAYGWLLLESVPFEMASTRWGVTLGTLTLAGVLIRGLHQRFEALVKELDASARRDPLTGALNRRGLDERLGIELARARRSGEPLCVLTADLDGLKELNDRYGHRAGDEALELTTAVIGATLRDVDVLARTGGDEFVMVLPSCEPAVALDIAELLRRRLRERSARESWPITLSAGVANAPPLPLDPETLLAAADSALYRAKALGRDRSSVAGRAELQRALHAG
jgi:diguanylate cyclase (GGDEF)-like protein